MEGVDALSHEQFRFLYRGRRKEVGSSSGGWRRRVRMRRTHSMSIVSRSALAIFRKFVIVGFPPFASTFAVLAATRNLAHRRLSIRPAHRNRASARDDDWQQLRKI